MANIEALNELIRVVQETPDHEFDMNKWACGSVGCALGRAAMDDYFMERGLGIGCDQVQYWGENYMIECIAQIVFSLPFETFRQIISPSSYRKDGWMNRWNRWPIQRSTVIARIQHIIDNHTLQRDAHLRDYRAARQVQQIINTAIEQAPRSEAEYQFEIGKYAY